MLDEVQGTPDLLRAIKVRVDRDKSPGQYLLTGSANLLAMRRVQETLAGRLAIHELLPLAWSELMGRPMGVSGLDRLFSAASAEEFVALLPRERPEGAALPDRILAGGYPTPALARSSRIRSRWFHSYVQSYVERDVPAIAGIEYLGSFQRLLGLMLWRSGNLLNINDIARTLGMPATTVHRYVDLLRLTYQVALLPPYAGNHEKRLVKTAKVYGGDSGLTAALTGAITWDHVIRDGRAGSLYETWVAGELRKLVSLSERSTELTFWRAHQGQEVDFMLRRGAAVAAIEAKVSPGGVRDALRSFRALGASEPVHLAVVLHMGDEALVVDERTAAVPAAQFFL